MKLDKEKLVWGFWQKSYIYLIEELSKVAMISGNISKDLKAYNVSISCIGAVENDGNWRIEKDPSSIGDGMKFYSFPIDKNSDLEDKDFMMKGLKKYIESTYNL